MANRHKHHAKGGGVQPKHDADKTEYDAQGSNVMKEAHEKKHGGRAKHAAGGKVVGRASGGRLDKRARGGGVGGSGKDMTSSPFSSAHIKPQSAGGAPHPHKSSHHHGHHGSHLKG